MTSDPSNQASFLETLKSQITAQLKNSLSSAKPVAKRRLRCTLQPCRAIGGSQQLVQTGERLVHHLVIQPHRAAQVPLGRPSQGGALWGAAGPRPGRPRHLPGFLWLACRGHQRV